MLWETHAGFRSNPRNVGEVATEQVTSGRGSTGDQGAPEAGEETRGDTVSPSAKWP